jgi:MFS transporter, DHA1 family, multidrug resistance protein
MGPALGTFLAAVIDKPHWMFWISGGLLTVAGGLVILWVHEIKQVPTGPWRPQWIGSLRELMAAPRVGELFFLSFIFAMLWTGSVTILSIFVLRILESQPGITGSVVFWAGAVAMALSLSSVVALPLWGRVIDRWGADRVLTIATVSAAVTQLPLLALETPLQLVLSRVLFGVSACAMLPAIVRLLRQHAPAGMDARAISYSASFQFIAMGLAPFFAGMIGPAWGLRSYFALTAVLTLIALVLWVRSGLRAAT